MKLEIGRIFEPAIRFLNQYSFPRKFAIVGALLALPLMFVTFQFIDALNQRVELSQRELAGSRCIRLLVPLWETLRNHRWRLVTDASDATERPLDEPRRFLDELKEHLARIDNAESDCQQILDCSARWKDFQATARKVLMEADPTVRLEPAVLKGLVEDLVIVFQQLGDQASLTLDPHLDSQNLAQTWSRLLPDLTRTEDHVRELICADLKHPHSQSDDVELAEASGAIQMLLTQVVGRLTIVLGESPMLGEDLRGPFALCRDSLKVVEAGLRARLNSWDEAPSPSAISDSVVTATNQTLSLMNACQNMFDRVVQQRRDAAQVRRSWLIVATLMPFVISAYLLIGLCLAIIRTANRMQLVTDRILLEDEYDCEMRFADTQDELGRMIEHFGRLGVRLREEWASAHAEAVRASQAEESLRANEERFNLVLQGTNDGIWDWDLATDRVLYSDRFRELLGYRDVNFGVWLSALADALHPDDFDATWTAVELHLRDHVPYVIEHRLRTGSGEYRWFLERGQAVWDENGVPVRMAGSISDITERKATDDRERIRNELLERVASGSSLAEVLEHLARGIEQAATDLRCSILLLGKSERHLNVAAAPNLPDFYNAAVDGIEIGPGVGCCGTAAALGERVIAEDIQTHPYWASYTDLASRAGLASCWSEPIRSDSGKILGTFAMYGNRVGAPNENDIKLIEAAAALAGMVIERKRAEELLRASEERWKFALEGAGDSVWDWNIETGEMVFSRRWAEMLGLDETQIESSIAGWKARIHPDDLADVMTTLQGCLNGAEATYTQEHRMVQGNGSILWMLSRGIVVQRDAEGRALRMIGTHSDITARKQTEEASLRYLEQVRESRDRIADQSVQLVRQADELAKAKDQADAAARAKSEFLANMSHELRTPLTAILGFADVLYEEGDLSKAPALRRDAVEIIRTNGKHLKELIDDILDLSKIDAGGMTLERSPVSCRQLVEDVLQLLKLRAKEKGLTLQCEFIQPMRDEILTDALRLRQILMNLVGNAIKFTESGSVTVRVRTDEETREQVFAVCDTGIGMKPEHLSRLFKPFSQADASMSRRFGGTGLGLSISKRLARILGGDIQAKSNFGVGSTFTLTIFAEFCLDATSPSDSSQSPEDISPSQPVPEPVTRLAGRILLAEDVPANQKLIAFLLRKAGAEVDVVDNGRQAVDKALAELQAGAQYDLILMDIQMPEMDGYTATAALREAEYRGRIVALTAHASTTDRQQCLASGFDGFATKPIDKKQLVTICREQMDLARSGTT